MDLLEEEGGGPAALVLWQSFRDVEVWARSTERADLFVPGAAEGRLRIIDGLDAATYAGAQPHLRVLVGMLRGPGTASAAEIAEACSGLAAWFERRGRLGAAVEFAQAACFVLPRRAALAVRVARLVRMLAEYPRSTSWFDHALYLARRSNDWQAYAEALAGLGNLQFRLGNLPRARHYHRRCLRVARRSHLREMVGAAYHNLFVLEMDAGNVGLADEHAARAYRAYPESSRSAARLARDLSRRWTVLGDFAKALPRALEVLTRFTLSVDRALVWADIARASGGAGEAGIFEDAWAETWVLVRQGLAEPFEADLLMDLAYGAASLGDAARASRAASRALEIATERKEENTVLEARALLERLTAPMAPVH